MSKYHQLVKQYADEIAEIKRLKAIYQKAELELERLQALPMEGEPGEPAFDDVSDAIDRALDKVYEAHGQYMAAYEDLSCDIEAEYNDVPFGKPARAGIDGFWRESGLK